MSTEEKYAAPPPAYDDATKLPGDKTASSMPPAGATPATTTQPQGNTNCCFFLTRNEFSVVQQVVYVQPSDPAGQLMHCNRCNCQVNYSWLISNTGLGPMV